MELPFRERILAHGRDPANHSRLSCPDCAAAVDNPLCGDQLVLELGLTQERVSAVGLAVRACLLTSASASMLRAYVLDRELAEAGAFSTRLRAALAVAEPESEAWPDCLRPLLALGRERARLHCLELPWLALEQCAAKVREGADG